MANPFTSKTASPAMPTDFGLQQEEILRQKRMADLLEQQGMEPLQGQNVGGIYVAPSWTQQLAKGLSPFMARKQREYAGEQEKELARQMGEERTSTLQKYADLLRGSPESATGQYYPAGGNPDEEGGMGYKPAVLPNKNAAIAALLQSRDPMLQQLGMQQQLKDLEPGKFGNTPHYDQQGRAYVLNDRGDVKYLDNVSARDKLEIGPAGQVYNPYQIKPGMVFQDPNKPFAIGAEGLIPNTPYQQYEKAKARAGAANVSVNTATKPFLTELGKGAAETVLGAFTQAQAANQTLQNAQQIRAGLDKAILGPTANARISLAQVGQTLGVTGKNTEELLSNTRNVIQGLARQELSAAGQMKGQGQITESERAILRKAEAGDVANLTKPEIETFLTAIEKTARYRIAQHQRNLEGLKNDPNAAPILQYLQVQGQQPTGQPKNVTVDY